MKNFKVLLTLLGFIGLGACKSVQIIDWEKEGTMPDVVSELIDTVLSAEGTEAQDAAVDSFIDAHRNTLFPVIEGDTLTFCYYADEDLIAAVMGWELNEYDKTEIEMQQVGDSRLYTVSVFIEDDMDLDGIQYTYVAYQNEESVGSYEKDIFNPNIVYQTPVRTCIRTPESDFYLHRYKKFQPETEIWDLKKRSIYVLLPSGYYENPEKSYPVFYMQDGQNLWDSAKCNFNGWKVDTTSAELTSDGEMEPIIIVGIENASDERAKEYVGFSTGWGTNIDGVEGLVQTNMSYSLAYEDFVINEVIPFVNENYRTLTDRENTAIGGSSYGAGVSLFLGFRNPDVFGKIAALSGGNRPYNYNNGSYDFSANPYFPYVYLIENNVIDSTDFKVWLDCGDGGGSQYDIDFAFLPFTQQMHAHMLDLGYAEGENLFYTEAVGKHNEGAWAKRMPDVFKFLFPANSEE